MTYRYRRQVLSLKGLPFRSNELEPFITACLRTGHEEDALLLRTVHAHQRRYAEDLQRHTAIECLLADLVTALNAGQAAAAKERQALLRALDAAVEIRPDGVVEWRNPIFAGAAMTEGPVEHELSMSMNGEGTAL